MSELLVGTSGFHYDHWQGVLYPEELPKRAWFAHYAERFATVEINNTFYNLPAPERFERWREEAPPGFTYALKYSRYGSHMKRLKDPEGPLGTFLERAERLGDRLGPILVQLPPKWRADPERLQGFLRAAPSRHRWAIEVRDARWLAEEVYAVLEAHGAALVVHDLLEDHPRRRTADWLYLRFHGRRRYRGSYAHQALTAEARRIASDLGAGRDVYAYFNNDERGYAVTNALQLRRFVANARRRGGPETAGQGRGASG